MNWEDGLIALSGWVALVGYSLWIAHRDQKRHEALRRWHRQED